MSAAEKARARRVTREMVDHEVIGTEFHVFRSSNLTVCAVTLRNGHIVTGESNCISLENFNEEIGREIAEKKARRKIGHLLAYMIREDLHREAAAKTDLEVAALYNEHAAWSDATFGPARGPNGSLNHLILEAEEAKETPDDPIEFADCLFLVFDAARRAGHDLEALIRAGREKLPILKSRRYERTPEGVPSQHKEENAA